MPWAVEIDPAHRPFGYERFATFQPTFLYESLWCLLVFGLLVWGERRFRFRPGQTFAAYVALYTAGRTFFEWLRIDDATRLFGVRFNLLLSIVLCVSGTTMFVILGRRSRAVGSVHIGSVWRTGEGAHHPRGADFADAVFCAASHIKISIGVLGNGGGTVEACIGARAIIASG